MARSVAVATGKGIPVIVTTDCIEGEVGKVYDFAGSVYKQVKSGALIGKDYDSKKARIKLAVMLSAGEDLATIQQGFFKLSPEFATEPCPLSVRGKN